MDRKDTQNELKPHETLAPAKPEPEHGVPDGGEAEPKGLPDAERHRSESGPHGG